MKLFFFPFISAKLFLRFVSSFKMQQSQLFVFLALVSCLANVKAMPALEEREISPAEEEQLRGKK